MANSPVFQKYKRLYHEERLPIKAVSITDGTGEVVFVDPDDGSETTVTGDADDFINAISAVKSTVRDGDDMLIDVTGTPAGSVEQYYKNMEYFLPSDTSRTPEEETHRVLESILNGEQQLRHEDFHKALDAAVNREMANAALQNVVTDYYTARASQLVYLKGFHELFASLPNDTVFDYDRFKRVYSDVESVLRDEYLSMAPEQAYKQFRDRWSVDAELLTKQLLDERKLSKAEWRGLLLSSDEQGEGTNGVTVDIIDREYFGDGDMPRQAQGEVDGETAVRRVVKEYADYYEAVIELFKHLAATVNGVDGDVELDSEREVLSWLEGVGEFQWTWAVSPEFRNAGSHLGVEVENESGIVRFFESKTRDREFERELTYKDFREEYRAFVDVVMGTVWAYTLSDQLLVFEYLRSRDFMFTVIENLPPDTL